MGKKFKPTDEQLTVIEHEGSHALVSAVAGAGKSTTLVEHIARRVQRGEDPRRIIAIQYNKSAQLSMQRKLRIRLDGVAAPEARTFHSIGNAMLKRLIEVGAMPAARFEKNTSVYDDLQRKSLREEWKRAHGRDAFPSQEQMEGFKQFVTRVKADVRPAPEVFRSGDYQIDCTPYIAAINRMDGYVQERGIYFFDDMLARTYSILLNDPDLWTLFSNKVGFIAVDEFQDINPVQYELLMGLVGDRAECMAIGDPDQAIYSFRGSDVRFICERFPEDFAPCKTYRMTNTFRYGHETALIANHIITKNSVRDDKITVAAPGNPDTQVKMVPQSPKQPSGLIAHLAEPYRDHQLRRQAMLVRYYSQSIPYEIELATAGIPFHVYGREGLLLIPEIACLVGAMSLAADHWVVPEALRSRFLGAMVQSPSIYATKPVLKAAGQMMADSLDRGGSAADALFRLADSEKVENDRLRQRLRKRADVVRLLEAGGLKLKAPGKIIEAYLSFTDFRQSLVGAVSSPAQAAEIEQNVNAFTQMASRVPSTIELLNTLGPLAGHQQDKPPEGDHLPILSMHRAKGLEWTKVYLPGWSALTFPREYEDIEEERRLAYVAVTRAIDELVFLYPSDATLDAQNRFLDQLPPQGAQLSASRFLYEGETGLSAAAATAIRNEAAADIACRRDAIVNRYAEEGGFADIRATIPPEVAQLLKNTSANQDLKVEPGQRLRNGQQLYEVTQKLGDRYYYVSPLSGGDPRLISLDEPGWVLA